MVTVEMERTGEEDGFGDRLDDGQVTGSQKCIPPVLLDWSSGIRQGQFLR